jgi:hypothetical protein
MVVLIMYTKSSKPMRPEICMFTAPMKEAMAMAGTKTDRAQRVPYVMDSVAHSTPAS